MVRVPLPFLLLFGVPVVLFTAVGIVTVFLHVADTCFEWDREEES